jgi:hypothetical protein
MVLLPYLYMVCAHTAILYKGSLTTLQYNESYPYNSLYLLSLQEALQVSLSYLISSQAFLCRLPLESISFKFHLRDIPYFHYSQPDDVHAHAHLHATTSDWKCVGNIGCIHLDKCEDSH